MSVALKTNLSLKNLRSCRSEMKKNNFDLGGISYDWSTIGTNQENHEIGRWCKNDQCRSSNSICEGSWIIYSRINNSFLVTNGRKSTTNITGKNSLFEFFAFLFSMKFDWFVFLLAKRCCCGYRKKWIVRFSYWYRSTWRSNKNA